MGNKISKASDAALARVTFKLKKSDIRFSYRDHLAAELLREQSTMAQHILSTKLSEDDFEQLSATIENMISAQPKDEEMPVEEFLQQYRTWLIAQATDIKRISTIHIMRDIVADTTTATSQLLAQYGITAQSIDLMIDQMTDTESFGHSCLL